MPRAIRSRQRFHVELIKPSHYDDDGYVIQWMKAWVPSNALACLYGLAHNAAEKRLLGEDIEITVNAYDETNTIIPIGRIMRRLQRDGGIVCLVGVQSNQFPRAMDMARRFRAAGLQVAIGGFHVSGCLAMLPRIPADIQEALDLGITIFAGEAEGRFDEFLRAAYRRQLQPLYNYMNDLPALEGQALPFLPRAVTRRYTPVPGTFDAGRGCPFACSFCTIINVQGRKSRHRTADDVERLLRANLKHGIRHYFLTDDNFARNRNWESIFDRIARLREELGVRFKFTIQVDTLCQDSELHGQGAPGRRVARLHRARERQPGQSSGRAQEPEQGGRVQNDAARVETKKHHNLLRLHPRFFRRHSTANSGGHRNGQA
jgi:hypothetical protein